MFLVQSPQGVSPGLEFAPRQCPKVGRGAAKLQIRKPYHPRKRSCKNRPSSHYLVINSAEDIMMLYETSLSFANFCNIFFVIFAISCHHRKLKRLKSSRINSLSFQSSAQPAYRRPITIIGKLIILHEKQLPALKLSLDLIHVRCKLPRKLLVLDYEKFY